MIKWYKDEKIDNDIVISSRIRLARNVNKYPFSINLSDTDAVQMAEDIKNTILPHDDFVAMQVNELSPIDKLALMERHIISPEALNSFAISSVLMKKDESMSIMINEEDHVRMQAIFPGEDITGAWEAMCKIDDEIESKIDYAFDKDFGYLTSCPTNTGTGLRASHMVHLPLLQKTGQIKDIVYAIGKFGMTIRGIYGEGTEPYGGIYQVSNQVTMGKSESEIMSILKNVTEQIKEHERKLTDQLANTRRIEFEDSIYRAYGILSNARKISGKEAMSLLSDLRLGYVSGVTNLQKPKENIYCIMMNIQVGSLQRKEGRELDEETRDVCRAEYLRGMF